MNHIRSQLLILLAVIGLTCTQKSPLDPQTRIHDKTPLISTVTAAPKTVSVGGMSVIKVLLLDEDERPYANQTVQFEATLGTVIQSAVTDSAGWVQVVFTGGDVQGTASITARYGDYSSVSVDVTISTSTDINLKLQVGNASIYGNGSDTTRVWVELSGDSLDLSSTHTVQISASSGLIDNDGILLIGQTGTGSLSLTSKVTATDIRVVITAVYDQLTVIDTVLFKGINFSIHPVFNEVIADGKSSVNILTILKESSSNVAIPSQSIIFSAEKGLIPQTAITSNSGLASVTLTSSTIPGTSRVTARFGAMTVDTTITFLAAEPSRMSISASPSVIYGNGADTTWINVTIDDNSINFGTVQTVQLTSTAGKLMNNGKLFLDSNGSGKIAFVSEATENDVIAEITGVFKEYSNSVQVLIAGIDFTIHPSFNELTADGKSTMSIQIVLREASTKVAISGETIIFSTEKGSIPKSAATNQSGITSVTLTSSSTPGPSRVTARFGAMSIDTTITFVNSESSSMVVTASPSIIFGNGADTTWINVDIDDSSIDIDAGQFVQLTSTAGKLANYGKLVLDSNGSGSLPLVSAASTSDVIVDVTASYQDHSNSIQVKFLGIDFSIIPSTTEILADGKSTSSIRTILKENATKIAISGETIVFSADKGSIPKSAVTSSSGLASATLTSSTVPGVSTITARFGNMSVDTTVTFLASEPTHMLVTASPSVIYADGSTVSTITATITDFSNNPVPSGINVKFSKVSGPDVSFSNTAQTNESGQASTSLTAHSIGTALIAVEAADLIDTVAVQCIAGEVSQITIESDKQSMKADGIENATITATVMDSKGNPLEGKTVTFTADYGDITQTVRTNADGKAQAKFSSSTVATATLKATVKNSSSTEYTASLIIELLAGTPGSINLEFDPKEIGVKSTGQNQTTNVYATVRDNKNNIVDDGTLVQFAIVYAPAGVTLSTTEPIPTVSGVARISCSSGTRSGSARISAEVLDENSVPTGVKAISSELIIHAGPPYIEDINRPRETTHMTIVARRLNIYAGLDTTLLTISVGDKYNNPVDPGTAVYVTTSGGFVTTRSYTDENGIVNDTLFAANPVPSVNRYYNYDGMQDPNTGAIITDKSISDFEYPPHSPYFPYLPEPGLDWFDRRVDNSYDNGPGDYFENNGVARILAYAVGMDANGNEAKAWDDISVVMSRNIADYGDNSETVFALINDTLFWKSSGVEITLFVYDEHGNPIASGSKITAELTSDNVQAKLSGSLIETGADQGKDYYRITITNAIDPEKPKPGWTAIKITVESRNGRTVWTTDQVYISEYSVTGEKAGGSTESDSTATTQAAIQRFLQINSREDFDE